MSRLDFHKLTDRELEEAFRTCTLHNHISNEIVVEIASDDDLSKIIDGAQTADMSIDRINQALAFIRRELDVVRTRNEEAFKLYRDLCGAAFVQE